MGNSIEFMIVKLVLRSDVDVSALVLRTVAILRCRKDCNAPAIMFDFIAFHTNLVASNDGVQSICFAESLRHVWPELHAHASFAGTATWVGLRVCPEHFHHQALLPRLSLLVSIELSYIIQRRLVVREETAVQREIFLANQSCKGQCRKRLREQFEGFVIVLGLTLAFEAIDFVHVVGLMIASIEEEGLWMQPLVGVEKQDNLGRPRTPVYKVAVEEVVMILSWEAVESEEFHQVEELPMSVATDGQLVPFLNLHLDHRWFRIDNIVDCSYYLEDVLAVKFLPVLESLDHVIHKILGHFGS